MTRREAETLMQDHEGRLCVRFFRRADGTVLTADCPVGWERVKRRVSRTITAAASMVFGFAGGLLAVRTPEKLLSLFPIDEIPPVQASPVPAPDKYVVSTGMPVYEVRGEMVVGKPMIRLGISKK
jgi:hypothetical protein